MASERRGSVFLMTSRVGTRGATPPPLVMHSRFSNPSFGWRSRPSFAESGQKNR